MQFNSTILFILVYFSSYIFSQQSPEEQERIKKTAGTVLKHYQVGLMSKIPDGPLSDEKLQKAMVDDWERRNGLVKNNTDIGIVYMAPNLRNKKLGKLRIQSEGIHMLFPTDANTIKYQDFRENENFQHFMENNRIEFEKNKLKESETKLRMNPYKEILDNESEMIKMDIFQVNKNHQKNLMQLAVDKEQEIFNSLVKNELQEVQLKSYNKGVINPILKNNALLEKIDPEGVSKDSQGNAKFIYPD
jgi:hypothetical protein